ncbi:MAG: AbrB/MazE/SpoVT family DNA-binding domain-containing protein [Bacteroidota bacterium]
MVRTIVKPGNQSILIEVPKNFIGKQVEIIAFTIDEAEAKTVTSVDIQTHFASEAILSKEWLTHEEDIAWQNL